MSIEETKKDEIVRPGRHATEIQDIQGIQDDARSLMHELVELQIKLSLYHVKLVRFGRSLAFKLLKENQLHWSGVRMRLEEEVTEHKQ